MKNNDLTAYIRAFNPFINSKTGTPIKVGQMRGLHEYWALFESCLNHALITLGYQPIIHYENPNNENRELAEDLTFYAHKTQRDVEGENLYYMQMYFKYLFTLDTKGWGADHSVMQNRPDFTTSPFEASTVFHKKLLSEVNANSSTKHPQPDSSFHYFHEREFTDLPEDFIFVPLQIPRDYVHKHHSNIGLIDFIRAISEWSLRSSQNVVFKLHPYNKIDKDIIAEVEKSVSLKKSVYCIESHVHKLIKKCQSVFTINSGVGFESIIQHKPVSVFGNCDYKWVCNIGDINNLDESGNYRLDAEKQIQVNKFLYYYFNVHAIDIRDRQKATNQIIQFMEKLL